LQAAFWRALGLFRSDATTFFAGRQIYDSDVSSNPDIGDRICRTVWSGHATGSALTKAPEPPAAVRA
jgi:hypothetical protein